MDVPLGWLRCHMNFVCTLNEHSNVGNFTIIDDGRELSINLLEAVWKVWFILSMNKLQVHAASVHHIRVYTYFWFCGKYYQWVKACVCFHWVFFTIIIFMKLICSKKSTVSLWRFLITPQSAVNLTTIFMRTILSRTYEVKRRLLLLQLWMHKNYF